MSSVVVLLVLAILLPFSFQAKPYNFRPESRTIDINEGEDYYIGFDQIDNKTIFGHCYYESATISGDYPIIHQDDNKQLERLTSDGFNTYNGTEICAFYYISVDDKTPLKWTITAFDNIFQTNFTEEVTITFYYKMPVYMNSLVALPGATLVNFFSSGQTKLEKCYLTFDNVTVELDIDKIKINDGDNVFKSRLSSFGDGKCGYRLTNLALNDPVNLTLVAVDNEGKKYRNTSKLLMKSISTQYYKNRTLQFYLGDDAKESDTSLDSDQKFCHLYNPLMSHDHMCNYRLDIVTKADLGTWKCVVGTDFIMKVLEFTTELVERKPESIEAFTEDKSQFFIIGCKLVNFEVNVIEYCKFTRPDGKMFKVTFGAASEFYNTITTDLDNGKCGLEILKPLQNVDEGTWKCEAFLPNQEAVGSFINVKKTTKFPFKKNTKKNVRLGNSFVVDCTVPFPSHDCYITAPNGTQYKSDSRFSILGGFCKKNIEKAEAVHNGTWSCSVAQKNGLPDEIITVEISIVELKVLYADAEAAENEEVDLVCNTNNIPIEHCRWVSPKGNFYSLINENSTPQKISYKGRGLEYGDCGLKISKVEQDDEGLWTCHIQSGRDIINQENTADINKKIKLTVSSPTSTALAESIGITMGVLCIVVATGGFVLYKYSRKIRCKR